MLPDEVKPRQDYPPIIMRHVESAEAYISGAITNKGARAFPDQKHLLLLPLFTSKAGMIMVRNTAIEIAFNYYLLAHAKEIGLVVEISATDQKLLSLLKHSFLSY